MLYAAIMLLICHDTYATMITPMPSRLILDITAAATSRLRLYWRCRHADIAATPYAIFIADYA